MCAYTRDWSETTPIDHTLNSSWPDYDRRAKVDVGDRLASIISGFVSGETVLGVLNLPFIAVSKPSTVTDQIQLYGKAVGGKTELHTCDEDGNEKQVTLAAGPSGLNLTAAQLMALTGPLIYPVGSIYINDAVSTNPATLFGFGTWAAITDRVIIGVGSTFTPVGATGGAATKTLSISEMPAHDHTVTMYSAGGGENLEGTQSSSPNATQTTSSAGGGAAFSIMNPYYAAYIWRRTA